MWPGIFMFGGATVMSSRDKTENQGSAGETDIAFFDQLGKDLRTLAQTHTARTVTAL